MDIVQLQMYVSPVVVGVCLCIGYIIKQSLTFVDNKYIPAIMGILGVVLAVALKQAFSVEILLTGLISGLASTGLHQAFTQVIINYTEDKDGE